jgi:HD-GYP domain-containing protein (c-di-GMP phosphodiesterase class II)
MISTVDNLNLLQTAGKDEHKLINLFFVLFRIARMYEANNSTYLNQSSKFYEVFRRTADSRNEITIKIVKGRVLIDEKLVRFDTDGLVGATSVLELWRRLGIGGMALMKSLDNRQIDKLVALIAKTTLPENDLQAVKNRIAELSITGIKLYGLDKKDDEEDSILSEDKRKKMKRTARVTFFRSISTVEDIMASVDISRKLDLSRTRRVVHTLIDQILDDESYLLQLTALKDFDEYTYVHSTNICIYSLTMGMRLGFDRQRLSQLGFASLFHDLGKVKLPGDLIRKPDVFDEYDWAQMQKHPELGAKTVLRNMTVDAFAARAALAAYEHHINEDFTGYPVLAFKRPTNLFSKIISIADTFDALTSGRVYIKKSISSDEVLRKMMYQMTKKFDPFLLKMFVSIIGIYPPGTLILLSSDELAIVQKNNPGDLSLPQVKIIGNRSGPFQKFEEVDLSLPENTYRRIVRIIDPRRYDIDMKAILLQDD